MSTSLPIIGVGAVIWNARGQVLLIKRARAPRKGEWSLPGGKVDAGETLHAALMREVGEETSLEIEILEKIDIVELKEAGLHYELHDFTARHISGDARAGSDAADVRWVSPAELEDYSLWSETRRIITQSAKQLTK